MQVRHDNKDGYTLTTIEKFEGVKYKVIDLYDRAGEFKSSHVTMEKCTDMEDHWKLTRA